MTNLHTRKIEELKKGFKGEILLPGDAAYEDARIDMERNDRQTASGHCPLRHHGGRR